jgi:hypothetical protein
MIVSLSIIFLLIAAVALLTCCSPRSDRPVSSYGSDISFLDSLSPGKYLPMVRLASQMDRRFLSSAHGNKLASCYRGIQRALLREYLRETSKDFNRLHAIATAKSVRATDDPNDLSLALFEQYLTFTLLIWGIEARLLLDDFLPFALDLKPLIGHLEGLAEQTRGMARSQQYSYQAF